MKVNTLLAMCIALCFCSPGWASSYKESSADIDNNTSSYATMQAVQVNNSATFGVDVDGTHCPTSGFIVSGTGSHSQDQWYDDQQDSATIGVSYQVPMDLNGELSNCQKSIAAKRRLTEMRYDSTIIHNCFFAMTHHLYIDPLKFPWAKKCSGIIQGNPDYLRKMKELRARAQAQRLAKQALKPTKVRLPAAKPVHPVKTDEGPFVGGWKHHHYQDK